jgi:hypothetical protein
MKKLMAWSKTPQPSLPGLPVQPLQFTTPAKGRDTFTGARCGQAHYHLALGLVLWRERQRGGLTLQQQPLDMAKVRIGRSVAHAPALSAMALAFNAARRRCHLRSAAARAILERASGGSLAFLAAFPSTESCL